MSFLTRSLLLINFLAVYATGSLAFGQSAWYEGFEGAEASWREAGGDVRYKILDRGRTGGAHTGEKCEWFRISADGGTKLNLTHDVGHPRVIEELLPTVWIRSDRPGMSLSANVVLPRTIDPRTNKPLVTNVAGEAAYNDVGRWQQLRIADLQKLVARQVRALRLQLGPHIDDREAYLDALLLNVYGGPGVTNVWIDDLDVAGYVSLNAATRGQVVASLPRIGGPSGNNPRGAPNFPATAEPPKRFDVKLTGSVLSVDGRPIFPRAIEHQGEPLAALKQLGFNAVWLKRLPTQELLEEADRLGLWLICPPPRPTRSDGSFDPAGTLGRIGPAFDRVLLWDLGGDLTPAQLQITRRWADQIRSADLRCARPLICKPLGDLRGYSQVGNNDMSILVDRRPLGTSMELKDYGTWVGRQPWVALPGTPMWTALQTQPNESLRRQIAALDPGTPPPSCVSFEQMRLLAYTAVAAGSRGVIFLSSSPLDAADHDTRQRAMSLELLNLEMVLLEPWAAAGNFWDKAESSEKQITATVLRADRGRLLLPIWSEQGAQCVPGQSAGNKLSFVVAAVPEESNAYEMTPGGLRKLPHHRGAGGLRVTFEEFSLTSQVLLAHDPLIVNGLMRRSENIGQRAARLTRDLAVGKLGAVQAVQKQLPQPPEGAKQLALWNDSARKNLAWCDAQLAARDYSAAASSADRALRALRMIERSYWDRAANNDYVRRNGISPATSPATLSFETLPLQNRLLARIRNSRGPNILPCGNFDDPNLLLQAGWQNIPNVASGNDPGGLPLLQTSADLLPQAAHSGPMGLRLTATPTTPETPPLVIETPPVRFVSPLVPAEVGQLVCIHGWIKVPKAIDGSVDGLMIYDNLGGEALAERIGLTADWRQFVLYRISTQPGGVNVTFSLTGLGEAYIDDVGIEVLEMTNL
ncbi:MAG: hypothetical protein IT426_01945 [Pirellulales bacterium]|nr:hypothetical protein [Pirellulales bacterium]